MKKKYFIISAIVAIAIVCVIIILVSINMRRTKTPSAREAQPSSLNEIIEENLTEGEPQKEPQVLDEEAMNNDSGAADDGGVAYDREAAADCTGQPEYSEAQEPQTDHQQEPSDDLTGENELPIIH